MKKFISSDLGGAPVFKNDLRDIFQTELWDIIEALLYPYTLGSEGIILSGCNVTGSGPYTISPGLVYLDGEYFRYAGETGLTLPRYIQQNPSQVLDNRTFADSTVHTVALTKEAGSAPTPAGGIQNINFTTPSDADERRLINILIPANNLVTNRILQALSAAQGVALASADVGLQNQIDVINTAWVTSTLSTSDIKNGSAVSPTSLTSGVFKYRSLFDRIEIDIDCHGITFASTPSEIHVSVPSAIRSQVLAFLRDANTTSDYRVLTGIGRSGSGSIPLFVGYANTDTSMWFVPLTGSSYPSASNLSISLQFDVLI